MSLTLIFCYLCSHFKRLKELSVLQPFTDWCCLSAAGNSHGTAPSSSHDDLPVCIQCGTSFSYTRSCCCSVIFSCMDLKFFSRLLCGRSSSQLVSFDFLLSNCDDNLLSLNLSLSSFFISCGFSLFFSWNSSLLQMFLKYFLVVSASGTAFCSNFSCSFSYNLF